MSAMGQKSTKRKQLEALFVNLPDPSHFRTPTQDQAAALVSRAIPNGPRAPAAFMPPPSSAVLSQTGVSQAPLRKPPVPGEISIGESEPDYYATGGAPQLMGNTPWTARVESRGMLHPEGLIQSRGAGRTDIHNVQVPAGSYIVPADVVSGLAEGNTMAGAGVMDRVMHSNPWGVQSNKARGGVGPPHSRASTTIKSGFKKGGSASHSHRNVVPIVVAGGELIYYPDTIAKKFGDLKKGHAALDAFVRKARSKNVKTLKSLPGPKR